MRAASRLEALDLLRTTLFEHASMFKKTFLEVEAEFGEPWRQELDLHLRKLLGLEPDRYLRAVVGYARYAIEFMRLQRLFDRKRRYEDLTYGEACEKVYGNRDYMIETYLPGVFLSHFLWRHHYRQFAFYKEEFLPRLSALEDKRFYEVGTGTGFYTVQIPRRDPTFRGYGIDVSAASRQFTFDQVNGWGFADRFVALDVDVTRVELPELPCLQCVEVLEHLPDPLGFLGHLRRLLRRGGWGFITAAITAPQSDHIYLYWRPAEVADHLVAAGFSVHGTTVEEAYRGADGEVVPKVAAFVVS